MREFRYRADIDGLRAVAVVLVLLFHAGLGFSGGFIGVDVFFTISGFLITGLILKEQAAGTFRLRDFWLRRVRRIIPAVSVMVFATLLVGAWALYPKDYVELAGSAIAQQFMAANVYFWRTGGYFNGPAGLKPLLHCWSLSVEEQFYLIYPLLLMFAAKRKAPTTWPRFVVLGVLFAFAQWMATTHARAAFFLLPARAWEMLLGGLLWSIPVRFDFSRRQAEVVSWISLATIFGAAAAFDSTTPFPGVMALVPCGATALLIVANWTHSTAAGRLLSTKPVVFLGLISYSLYLWHWPILAFAKYRLGDLSPLASTAFLAVSFLVAYLSWRFVEEPFRRERVAAGPRKLLGGFVAAVGLLLLATSYVRGTEGIPQRYDRATQNLLASMDTGQFQRKVTLAEIRRGSLPQIGAKTGPVRVLLWGDSHAMTVAPLIDQLCKDRGIRGELATFPSTLPVAGFRAGRKWEAPTEYGDAVLRYVARQDIEVVLLVGYWSRDVDEPGFSATMQRTVALLNDAGCHVVLVRDVPEQPNIKRRILMAVAGGRSLDKLGVSLAQHRVRQANADAVLLSLQRPNVTVLDPTPFLLDSDGTCQVISNGVSLYRNADHLSGIGAQRLAEMFAPTLPGSHAGSTDRRERSLSDRLIRLPAGRTSTSTRPQ